MYADAANVMPVDKNIFRKLMQGIFMFNEKLITNRWCHNGKSLSPTLADFFLIHLEKMIFAKFGNNGPVLPKVYLRYINNMCVVFADTNSCSRFLSILNSQHNDKLLNLLSKKQTKL